jgi:hypothetical protein
MLNMLDFNSNTMGFFSWKTCDTNRSIANAYSDELTFDVYMITPDGRVFHETYYDGYGVVRR